MRKHLVVGIALLITAVWLSGCLEPVIEGEGTIVYVEIEGGFYGIIFDTEFEKLKRLDPINLPSEFMEDGLPVRFKAKILRNYVSVHMWGVIVEIIEIERIDYL
jgi:hypothetical protein